MTIGRVDHKEFSYSQKAAVRPGTKREDSKDIKRAETKDQVRDEVALGSKDDQPAAPKKWTIMHYSAGDNNLMAYLVTDINEMEKVGSTKNMNIVVQLDKGNDDCKRYYLTQDGDMNAINSPVIGELGSTNMSDPKVLADFISSTMKKYPAEHYALIISDHGGGWTGAIEDDSHNGWMSTPDIQKGIAQGEKDGGSMLDVIGFDACQMGNTEVAYELKDNAKFLVASEETEGNNGWPYTPLLSSKSIKKMERVLRQRLNITPEELAKKMVTSAGGDQATLPTMAAIDLSKMDLVAGASDNFAKAILTTDASHIRLTALIKKTQSFDGLLKDQYHFAQQVLEDETITDKNLKETAKGVMEAINTAVIAEEHSPDYPNAHGLTADITSWGGIEFGYEKLKFRRDTKWAEAMNWIHGADKPQPYPTEEN